MPVTPVFPNSATLQVVERLVLKRGRLKTRELSVKYGVFDNNLGERCLVDTGYSHRITQGKRSFFLSAYAAILRPKLTEFSLPAAEPDISAIILTHLHADHVSALKDYPNARIYADKSAIETFLSGRWPSRIKHGVFKELLPSDLLERTLSFQDCKQVVAPMGLGHGWDIFGDGSVLAIPLPGHMLGHTGVLWTQGQTSVLYAADAEWLGDALLQDRMPGFPARFILRDYETAKQTAQKIKHFHQQGGKVVLCHDPSDHLT